MENLTVIIPIHKMDDSISEMLTKAVDSFKAANFDGASELMLVLGKDVDVNYDFTFLDIPNLRTLSSKKSDFCNLINEGVEECKTKYFSILEFDDVYTPNWFKNVQEHLSLSEDISLYLPLTEIVISGEENKGSIGYVNEAVWASSFSDEIGYIDMDCLQDYMNFNTTGGVFRTDAFLAVGGLKPSMKLSFWYEFLLRMIYNSKKVYVIPKVGYIHLLGRKDSVSDTYNATMSSDEADWWIETAKKEYYFKSDRKKTYEA